MATPQKNEFEDKNRKDDIKSQSGQAATQVNKTQEMHSQQGQGPGLRNVKNEDKDLDRQKVDEEDDEIVGEREDQEEGRVKNFKDSSSDARH